jgi:hypothetical protein
VFAADEFERLESSRIARAVQLQDISRIVPDDRLGLRQRKYGSCNQPGDSLPYRALTERLDEFRNTCWGEVIVFATQASV